MVEPKVDAIQPGSLIMRAVRHVDIGRTLPSPVQGRLHGTIVAANPYGVHGLPLEKAQVKLAVPKPVLDASRTELRHATPVSRRSLA